ncbi:uncharacterized protein [Periplaneta americana]|uniref:uncharacterized protein isoform X4 n=1 Tax=Periplaneta americana TaxID=6978 RepID=UPI0037E71EDC
MPPLLFGNRFLRQLYYRDTKLLLFDMVERNILDLQVKVIKTECMDHNYDIKAEMTFDETPVPIDISAVRGEVELSAVYEEGNELDLHMTEIKTEYMDKGYDQKSEITFDETPVPIDFTVLKSEFQEETHKLDNVEKEFKLEVTAEEDEVFAEGFPRGVNCDEQREWWRTSPCIDQWPIRADLGHHSTSSDGEEEEEALSPDSTSCGDDQTSPTNFKDATTDRPSLTDQLPISLPMDRGSVQPISHCEVRQSR